MRRFPDFSRPSSQASVPFHAGMLAWRFASSHRAVSERSYCRDSGDGARDWSSKGRSHGISVTEVTRLDRALRRFARALLCYRGMERVPTEPTTARRTETANVFRVESGGLGNWVVYRVGDPKTQAFSNQDLAVVHAQECARGKRPSVVVVVEPDGTVIAGWEFPLEPESIP